MTVINVTKCIGHSWDDLFNLVIDVERYPKFVPHCREVRLLSRKREPCGSALWQFAREDDDRCTVVFSADYQFESRVLETLASRVFSAMFAEILNAFERRAGELLVGTKIDRAQRHQGTIGEVRSIAKASSDERHFP